MDVGKLPELTEEDVRRLNNRSDHHLDALRYGLTANMQPPKRLPLWRRIMNWILQKINKA
jgi:hypothetical protein